MKNIIRIFIYNSLALYLAIQILGTIQISDMPDGFIITAGALTLLNMLIKPILKIIVLPINLITFGLLSWIVNVGILYILVSFVSYVNIQPLQFAGFSYHGISVSAFSLNDWQTYIATSLLIAIIESFAKWLTQ